ncbi:MAG: hypothetical protein NC311_10040 [Muribaculaceae bacterium]|nr:hypothetical protein [Muribaculaceae bacterium]
MARIKHWQGYGSVDAKKLADYPAGHAKHKTIIKITGNHEYGISRQDPYDVHRWLGKKFFPDCADYRRIESLNVIEGSEKAPDGTDTDTAIYEITYWTY